MADLEYIDFTPMREVVEDGNVRWVPDKLSRRINGLPEIFWSGVPLQEGDEPFYKAGEPWHEANHWALTKATATLGGHPKTVKKVMEHLVAYASWLESKGLDWRHFPSRKEDRAVVLFRGELIGQRDRGSLKPSTTSARMRAVLHFYRHCQVYGLVDRKSPLWKDRQVVIRYFDTFGFTRTLQRTASELSIPNNARPGDRLEDGLTPLRQEHAVRLLEFTKEQGLMELNLMLSLGALTGARISTITTLGVKNIEDALPDDQTPDSYLVPVGPATGVNTKFDVSGNLMVPKFLRDSLLEYAYSTHRVMRQGLASEANRGVLFLSMRGNPYGPNSMNPLMSDLRERAVSAGLRFMESFKFHQTRATFGTWLMGVALKHMDTAGAVAFVRDAMLHKHEATTLGYVRFLEKSKAKAQVASEFSALFSGIANRDWNQHNA